MRSPSGHPRPSGSFRQALRMLRRDWRGGELALIAVATAVAVAATTSVAAFIDRVQGAMVAESASLIGGDLALTSAREFPDALLARIRAAGVRESRFIEMRSVVTRADRVQLVELKAVDEHYPLRGELMIAARPFGPATARAGGPGRGEVWVEPRLLGLLDLAVGDRLRIGAAEPIISAVLALEPDRGGGMFTLAPRVMMPLADLEATTLVSAASRLTHQLLLAGDESVIADLRAWLADNSPRGVRVQDVTQARPEMDTAMSRARLFLGIAAWVSLCIGAIAIATAARRYAERHVDAAALMRCLGARQNWVLSLYCWQLLVISLAAALAGVAIGYATQALLARMLQDLAAATLPAPGPAAAVTGVLTALIAVFGFALPPLLRMRDVPPGRVLGQRGGLPTGQWRWLYALSAAGIVALSPWQDLDTRSALWLLGGTLATVLALALGTLALIAALAGLRGRVGVAWRYGLANVVRRPRTSLTQAIAVGIGIMVLLLLLTVHRDMLAHWRASLPADAPNNFLINIQPDQVAPLQRWLAGRGLSETRLYPMVRGRLVSINGKPVSPDDYDDPRAQRLAAREFNLSTAKRLKHDNRLLAGQWWDENTDPAQFSFERDIAAALGVGLGDELTYDIAGETLSATITSIREVDWDSFEANFFVVSPPALLAGQPATWITAFHLPAARSADIADLVETFPSVTVLNIEALLARVRAIIDNVSRAIAFVFSFTLVAGALVLFAAIQAGQDERLREAAVLRALGADAATIRAAFLAELLSVSLIGGLVAGLCAAGIGYGLATAVFRIDYLPSPAIVLLGAVLGLVVGAVAALLPMRGIMRGRAKDLLAAG